MPAKVVKPDTRSSPSDLPHPCENLDELTEQQLLENLDVLVKMERARIDVCGDGDPSFEDDETARFNVLNDMIDDNFGQMTEEEALARAEGCEHTVTQMLRVEQKTLGSASMMDVMTDVIYEPVIFPADIWDIVHEKDVFLMTLGLRQGAWHVLYSGPCYETVEGYW